MSCAGISCNQGCEPCRDGCHKRQAGVPVRPLGAEEPVDTYRLPPGGFWFAPGAIDEPPAPEPLSGLEKSLIAMAGTGVVALLAGLGYGWWKGLL